MEMEISPHRLALAILGFQLANALVLGGDGLADTRQICLLGFKLTDPAPDGLKS